MPRRTSRAKKNSAAGLRDPTGSLANLRSEPGGCNRFSFGCYTAGGGPPRVPVTSRTMNAMIARISSR